MSAELVEKGGGGGLGLNCWIPPVRLVSSQAVVLLWQVLAIGGNRLVL